MYKASIGTAFGHSIYSDLCVEELCSNVTEAFDAIDSIFQEYHMGQMDISVIEDELFEESNSSSSGSLPERLGAAIRALLTQIGHFIENIGKMFMSDEKAARKQQAELEKEINKNPDLKRKVMELSAAGALNLRDVGDINALVKEVDKLMEEKNPKTFKGKLEKLQKEWKEPDGRFLKTVGAISTTAGVIAVLFKLGPDITHAVSNLTDAAKANQKQLEEFSQWAGKHGSNIKEVPEAQIRYAAKQYKKGKQADALEALKYKAGSGEKKTKGGKEYNLKYPEEAELKFKAIKFKQECINDVLNATKHNEEERKKGMKLVFDICKKFHVMQGTDYGKGIAANAKLAKQSDKIDARQQRNQTKDLAASVGAKAGARAGSQAGTKSGYYAGSVAGARSGERAGAQSGYQAGSISGAAAGAREGAKSGAVTGGVAGSRSGKISGANAGYQSGAVSGAAAGASSGAMVRKPGNQGNKNTNQNNGKNKNKGKGGKR